MNHLTLSKNSALVLASLIGVLANGSHAQTSPVPDPQVCSTVTVEGLKPGVGVLYVAGYSSEETYFKKPTWQVRVKVTDASMQLKVCNVNAEEIAFMGYQDLNDNGKLDANPLGIPSEPYGASGTPPMFSSPTWLSTRVKLNTSSPITIKM